MVLHSPDSSRIGDTDDHREENLAPGPVAHLRHVANHLFEGGVGEGVELHLDDRAHAVHRHADGHTHDARFRQRRVEAAFLTEPRGEAVRDAEDPTQRSHVLPEHQDGFVGLHGIGKARVECLGEGDRSCGGCAGGARGAFGCLRHGVMSSRISSSRSRSACSRSWEVFWE